MSNSKLALFCLLTPLLMVSASSAQAPSIHVKFITIQVPGADETDLYGINNFRAAVGSYLLDGTGHGLMISGGKVINIDDWQNGSLTTCIAINSSGTIVGHYNNFDGVEQGFLYQNGSFTDIGPSGDISAAYGINDLGMIVGHYYDSGGNEHGFLYDGNTYTTLDVPGATGSGAWGINNSGLITMFWTDSNGFTEGSLYDGSKFTTIDVPGATSTYPRSINSAGDIVLSWSDSEGNLHGALLHSGHYYKFNDPNGTNDTEALGVNDKAIVVGRFQPTGSPFFRGFAATR